MLCISWGSSSTKKKLQILWFDRLLSKMFINHIIELISSLHMALMTSWFWSAKSKFLPLYLLKEVWLPGHPFFQSYLWLLHLSKYSKSFPCHLLLGFSDLSRLAQNYSHVSDCRIARIQGSIRLPAMWLQSPLPWANCCHLKVFLTTLLAYLQTIHQQILRQHWYPPLLRLFGVLYQLHAKQKDFYTFAWQRWWTIWHLWKHEIFKSLLPFEG